MADASVGGHVEGLGATQRTDQWWIGPAVTAAVFTAWLVYFFVAAAQGKYYAAGPYISPFYISYVHPDAVTNTSPTYALFGFWPAWWPALLSPALFVGFLPGAFRVTCYYYRKAYYRAYFATPPGCAVGPVPQRDYRGETGLLIFQNLHRYTLYIAILMLPLLYWETVLLGNSILLSAYTLGCHAWRHLIGGKLNCFSCDGVSEARHGAWRGVSWLNSRHMLFAWSSLLWIASVDIFIRLVAMGVIPDINTWSGVTWISDFTHL
jgi:hypothetical protein